MGGPHHMGTTRMSADPNHGVVDADCRMHTVDNLYIAGSSVFATGGYANPTFTLVALALRLADKLRDRLSDKTRSAPTRSPRSSACTRAMMADARDVRRCRDRFADGGRYRQ